MLICQAREKGRYVLSLPVLSLAVLGLSCLFACTEGGATSPARVPNPQRLHLIISFEQISPVLLLTASSHIHQLVISQPPLAFGTYSCSFGDDCYFHPHSRYFANKHAVLVRDSMAGPKDNTVRDMLRKSVIKKASAQNAISNHERDTEPISRVADDMALGMKISTSTSGQTSAIGTGEETDKARPTTRDPRPPLTD